MSNACIEKATFVKEALIVSGLEPFDIEDEHMREVTLYRKGVESSFILVTVAYDFRDQGWAISFEVGDGFPEQAEDPVEYQIATISLTDLDILNQDSTDLPYDIEIIKLKELFQIGIEYCIKFTAGYTSSALEVRNARNIQRSIDPLWLESDNSHIKEMMLERNEELKTIYAKYL
jgi:hypothetical protein